MRLIISILSGLLVFVGCFTLNYFFIGWFTNAIGTPENFKFAVKLLLFIFTGGLTLVIAIFAGGFVGGFVDAVLNDFISERRKKNLQKRK